MSTRKQVTYSRKRGRTKAKPTAAASSPLAEHQDPDQYLSHSELSRRLHKRAFHSPNPHPASSRSKRLKLTSPSPSQSSRPLVLTENSMIFSPTHRSVSRTPSRKLKENASARGLPRAKTIASLHPKSPASSRATAHLGSSPMKNGLSDMNYSPNIHTKINTTRRLAHTSSTSQDPPPVSNPFQPFANPQTASTRFTLDFQSMPTQFCIPETDINTLPFPLLPDGGSDQFFIEAQGISTPASKKRTHARPPHFAADPSPQEPDLVTAPNADVDLSPVPSGLKALPARERSPWLSDSLISPPLSEEWYRVPQEATTGHPRVPPEDVEMTEDISLGLGLTPGLPSSTLAEEEDDPTAELTWRAQGANSVIDSDPDPVRTSDFRAKATNNRLVSSSRRSFSAPSLSANDTTPSAATSRPSVPPLPLVPAPKAKKKTKKPNVPVVLLPSSRRAAGKSDSNQTSSPDEIDVFAKNIRSNSKTARRNLVAGTVRAQPKAMIAIAEEDESDDELLLKPGFNVWE